MSSAARAMCSSCIDCIAIIRRVLTPRRVAAHRVPGSTPPTAQQLMRHGKRYGWEGVAETAAEYGIAVTLPEEARRKPQRARRVGPTLRQRIATMLEEGRGPDFIAEAEDLSPSRTRRLIAEITETKEDA